MSLIPEYKSLPEEFLARLSEIIPQPKWNECLRTFSMEKPTSFRVNHLMTSPAKVFEQCHRLGLDLNQINWFAGGFSVPAEQRRSLLDSGLVEQGMIYVQNSSSFLSPLLLTPESSHRILDLAAAPGGKTLLLAELTDDQAWISAVESVKSRFFKLKTNLKKQGVKNVHTYLTNGMHVWKKCPEQFDRVLLDAPCSSEARFSVLQPRSYQYWSERKINDMCRKQMRLLFSAVQCLRPGGELIYCTCSFAPEENEQVVARMLHRFGGAISIQPISLPIENHMDGLQNWRLKNYGEQMQLARRVLPTDIMQGIFLCKLKKHRTTME